MPKANYNELLSTIPFYQKHWEMIPFVGREYESSLHKKLLIVGESHYMPEGSKIHHDVSQWYGENPGMSPDERRFCDTRGAREGKSGRFGVEIERCLKQVYSFNENAWQQVASINYFLRPADNKQNVENLWDKYGGKELDCEKAIRNFIKVIEILKPDLFVFASWLVCNQAEHQDFPHVFGGNLWDWTATNGVSDYIYVNHPSSPHWNSPMTKYFKAKDLTSREFFCKWLRENWLK